MQVRPSPPPGRHTTGRVDGHRAATANIIEIQIAGKVIGRCRSISPQRNFGTQPLPEIGSMMPAELIPLLWSGRLAVDRYLLRQPFEGQSAMGVVTSLSEDILFKQLFDIVILDQTTRQVIKRYIGCVQESGATQIAANQVIGDNASFLYLDEDDKAAGSATPTSAAAVA